MEEVVNKAKTLNSETKDKYSQSQQYLPTDLGQELSSLELLAENVSSAMEEKDREFKRARTVRSEYLKDVEEVQLWIQEAEKKVQDQTAEPQVLKEFLQVR